MLDSTQSSDGVITKPSSKSVAQTIDGLGRLMADRGFTESVKTSQGFSLSSGEA